MSEARFDPIRHEWVVIARDRERRPSHFRTVAEQPKPGERCPFCVGNEQDTTTEVLAAREPGSPANGPAWRWRVVTNLFPIVQPRPSATPSVPPPTPERCAAAHGMHEVVVETPDHGAHPADYSIPHLAELIGAFRQRARAATASGFPHVTIFRNQFAPAGASLLHPHTQIVGLPHATAAITRMHDNARRHRAATGRCLTCDVIAGDIADGSRVIARGPNLVAYAPYASRFSFEVWIAPLAHPTQPFLRDAAQQDVELAELVRDVVFRIRSALRDPAMNWVLHAGIGPDPDQPDHWRFEILPRLARIGGFELGSGVFVNSVAPEDAASRLRAE